MQSTQRILLRSARSSTWVATSLSIRPASSRLLHATPSVANSEENVMAKIKADLKNAMRGKDSFASTVYRSLLSEHQYAAKSAGAQDGVASMLNVIQKALARRQESARQFRAAKPPREDLAEKEDKEAELIRGFLPQQIDAKELEGIITKAIDEAKQAGIDGRKMMGEVMKRVNGQVDKARAPGSLISEAVKRLLS